MINYSIMPSGFGRKPYAGPNHYIEDWGNDSPLDAFEISFQVEEGFQENSGKLPLCVVPLREPVIDRVLPPMEAVYKYLMGVGGKAEVSIDSAYQLLSEISHRTEKKAEARRVREAKKKTLASLVASYQAKVSPERLMMSQGQLNINIDRGMKLIDLVKDHGLTVRNSARGVRGASVVCMTPEGDVFQIDTHFTNDVELAAELESVMEQLNQMGY